ncbi:MAG: nucleotide sugar dehydrogenase [Actinomycetota bacterium]
MTFDIDVAVVGGCGRAGLPLAMAFADRGLKVAAYDIDGRAADAVNAGRMPFLEEGAEPMIRKVVGEGRLEATTSPDVLGRAEHVIVVIGTPVDEHLNPDIPAVTSAMEALAVHLMDGQALVLRSTVYPGVTRKVEALLDSHGLDIDVSFCPERIAEGKALSELFELPQIVAARTERSLERAEKLFRNLTAEIVRLEPEEAELAKLFTNAWRYIRFAAANQFFMMANDFGLDFEHIRTALAHNYPRAADMPGAGLAAGPCLFKDTAQLAAFNNHNFHLGQAAMSINEGLPLYLVSRIEQSHDLADMTIGVLGMSFKRGSDDPRSSLSYKLKRILRFKARGVLCTDPYVTNDTDLVPLDEVVRAADLLIIATPHDEYRDLKTDTPIVDIWGVATNSVRV